MILLLSENTSEDVAVEHLLPTVDVLLASVTKLVLFHAERGLWGQSRLLLGSVKDFLCTGNQGGRGNLLGTEQESFCCQSSSRNVALRLVLLKPGWLPWNRLVSV